MKSIESICEFREKIQNLVDSRKDELQEAFLSCDASHDSIEKIKAEYEEKVNPYRLLHIGIVGRVKAGKSSLLNSLFFDGKNILPKAATPMTAALTKLYYSEKLEVKINFFDSKDIEELKKASEEYEKLLASKTEEEMPNQIKNFKRKNNAEPIGADLENVREKAKESAARKLKTENFPLCGEAEQYELYKNSDLTVKNQLGKPIELNLNDISELEGKLADYVGANGRFTAITSNVEIGFPNENLKDIIVVDTPGFDDPVASRDTMARDALRICDAIFVLSSAGSFCNQEDRSNISKIEKGEGIQEVFVVASKIDDVLCAPEYKGKNIDENLSTIVSKISGTLESMLDGMKNEGIASKTLLDRLYQSTGTNLLFTSGMCQSMFEQWENKNSWNEEFKFIFERLKKSYPEYFGSEDDSAKAMLGKIGNISFIKSKIDEVRSRKDEILKKREDEFLFAKSENLKEIMQTLFDSVESRKNEVETGDIGALESEKKRMNECYDNLKADFIEAFEKIIEEYEDAVAGNLKQYVSDCYDNTKSDINDVGDTETRSKTVKQSYTDYEEYLTTEQYQDYEQYTENVKTTQNVKVRDNSLFGFKALAGDIFGIDDWSYTTQTVETTRPVTKTRPVTRTREVTRTRPVEKTRNVQESYNVFVINSHEIVSEIKEFASSLEFTLEDMAEKMKMRFKKNLKNALFTVWSKYEVAEYCSNSERNIQANQIISSLPDVSFSIKWNLPENLSRKGKLEDDEAKEFEANANDALLDLRTTYNRIILDFSKSIGKTLDSSLITNNILEKMANDITKLTEQIKNKQEVLFKFEKLKSEISALKSEVEA